MCSPWPGTSTCSPLCRSTVDRQATNSRFNSRRSSNNTFNNNNSSNSRPLSVLGCSAAWMHPAPPSDQGGGAAMWPWEKTWLPVQPQAEHSQPNLAASITPISCKRQRLLIWQQRWIDWLIDQRVRWNSCPCRTILSESMKCEVNVGNTANRLFWFLSRLSGVTEWSVLLVLAPRLADWNVEMCPARSFFFLDPTS